MKLTRDDRRRAAGMQRLQSVFACLLLALLTVSLAVAPRANAQRRHEGPPHTWPSSLPDEDLRIRPERIVWTGQLQMARQIGARALVGLRRTPRDDSAPVDSNILQAARDNYMLIRAAKQGMEVFMGNQKFPDPVMDLALQRITTAWHLARTPVDKYSWGLSREQYLTDSIDDLSKALRILDQTLVLLP